MSKPKKAQSAAKPPAELCLFGGIGDDGMGGGITAKWFDAQFKALGDAGEIVLRINSPGGDVFEAMAIYTVLNTCRAKVTARIEGIAASAASLIAMAASKIEIAENAFMLIHQPYTYGAGGTADDLKTASEDLQRMTDQYVGIYAKRSGKDADEILSLMKEDRLMTAGEAVEIGLCDAIIDPSNANVDLKFVPTHLQAKVSSALPKESSMAFTADEMTALRALLAKAAKAEDDDKDTNAKADGYSEDGDENDDKPSNAKKKAKAKADDDKDMDAEDDSDMDASDDGDEDDKPAARKAKAKSGLGYAAEVANLCTLAGQEVLIAGFLRDRTPIADISKKLLKARAESAEHVSNTRTSAVRSKLEDASKSWDAPIAKLKR